MPLILERKSKSGKLRRVGTARARGGATALPPHGDEVIEQAGVVLERVAVRVLPSRALGVRVASRVTDLRELGDDSCRVERDRSDGAR
jgi:hypothetical protein